MNSVFSEKILADKLSNLNSTQQCIETLSHWCIFHRDKAPIVVATWDKQFHSSRMAQKVPLLYLANDILQNSKRKGNEFVTEFWKVLPAAVKEVTENGDDRGKNVVSRLVKIWEERRVFGSKARNLENIMLGEELPPALEFNKKRFRSVKIVRRDSRSIRTKLSIGGSAEKIVSAFHLVVSELPNEDAELRKCKSSVNRVKKMEQDVDIACMQDKDPRREILAKDLDNEENILKQCIEKLKSVEANRVALVSQLKEALHEQESELENVRTQVQVALIQAEKTDKMRKQLTDENYISFPKQANATPSSDVNETVGQKSKKTAADIAAEVVDKLTASSSSQLIMSSVLSTFAAEEAKNAALLNTTSVSSSELKLEPVAILDPNVFTATQLAPAPASHLYPSMIVSQSMLQNPNSGPQSHYQVPSNVHAHQYVQVSAGITGVYAYSDLPPLPPIPPPPLPLHQPQAHMLSPMPLAQQQLQIPRQQISVLHGSSPATQQQPLSLTQQPQAPLSFRALQPPGMVYYAHRQ